MTTTTTSYCYRLYAGNGNWITLDSKTTQDLLAIFEKGVSCRYPLTDQLFIDIIPNDVDCNSKNIDMLGLMRADLVYEPLDTEAQVQQSMSHYVRSLLNEQGIIDAFPPLKSDGNLPSIDSLPTHRHLSLVPSTVNSTKRRSRVATTTTTATGQTDHSKRGHRKSFESSASESSSTSEPPVHSFLPLSSPTLSTNYGYTIPGNTITDTGIQKKSQQASNSASLSSSSSSPMSSTQKNNSDTGRVYFTRSSQRSYNKRKKHPEMSALENPEEPEQHHQQQQQDGESNMYTQNHHHQHHQNSIENMEWFSPSSPSSLWMTSNPTSFPSPLRGNLAFYNGHSATAVAAATKLETDSSHPISPADIIHQYHHFTKGPMINIAHPSSTNTFDHAMLEDNHQHHRGNDCIMNQHEENIHYNTTQQDSSTDHSMESNMMSPIPTSTSPWNDKKQTMCIQNWKDGATQQHTRPGTESPPSTTAMDVMHCLDYEKYHFHPNSSSPSASTRDDIKSRTNILSHQ